ncbi:DUF3299 domain-containing protein [Novipirellula artificiosorum]|uniref:DUF4190 domain-containing protein n=1 Tax=Novipirellula artificiosorum TaxID=2528016 RepID=A0A5C6E2H8_9BACT|nr:DUF3299 domain-containing protein [Novipirellula artificiosorum]TWU42704.1 hypothetical protein Poly41_10040 [Novipirellula artificiosorum]
MSTADDAVDFPYRAVNRPAIASVFFFILALPGLIPTFAPMLVLAFVGLGTALVGARAIRRYPNEYSGGGLAMFGMIANLSLLIGGSSLHAYIFMTEVPEGYQRVPFYQLQQPDEGPDFPTEFATGIDGEDVFIKGYIHPSSGSGLLRQFILVPDLGTCCFGGQPKSTAMIEVTLAGGKSVEGGMIKRKLAGKFTVNRVPHKKTDFDNIVFYRLKADQVR